MHAAPAVSSRPDHPAERFADPDVPSDERTYSMILHLTLASVLLSIPPVIAPLIMWLVKRETSHFINDHGKEAVNFQLSLVLYSVVAGLVGVATCGVGLIAIPIVWVLGIVGVVLGALAANRGEYFRYPATIRFIP